MSLVQTPITAIASNYQGLYVTVTNPLLPSSIFDNFSSANQLSFLPGLFSSTWCNLNFGSTLYVSTLISPYAVIVGPDNTVGGIYTLTAGISNSNFGSNAFVGGCNSYGADANIIAYGTGVGAISTNAAAFGSGTWVTGQNSVAFGHSSMTFIGSNQHAHGELSIADGTASHAEGWSTIVYSDFSHVEGSDTQIWAGVASHAEGIDTWISSLGVSHVEGLSTFVYGGEGSHAEGAFTVADVGVAHAEGEATIALGSTAHTQGFFNIASTFQSNVGGILSNVIASNAHVEGAYNLNFMPNGHTQGLSTINLGWVNHNDGLQHLNQGLLGHIEGFSSILLSPIVLNNSTFVKSFSSLITLRTVGNLNFGYNNSVINHIEGGIQFISSPSYICHIEGLNNNICATGLHMEGASNSSIHGLQADNINRNTNIATGEFCHIEGLANATYVALAETHIEGASNGASASNNGVGTPNHYEGFGHRPTGGMNTFTAPHFEGSNNLGAISQGGSIYPSLHKEGANNGIGLYAPITSVAGENNVGPFKGFVAGYNNDGNTTIHGYIYGANNFIYNRFGAGNTNTFVAGLSNWNSGLGAGRVITHIGNYQKPLNPAELSYGNTAFFHSSPTFKLIRGSAESYVLNLRAITSSVTTTYSNFIYTSLGHNYLGAFSSNILSSLTFNSTSNDNSINYPASNQVTYINAVDLKLTGYQSRRTDSSGGFGFYSANFSFAVYRDNTNTSNLCIYDMVSQSTVRTNVVSVIPISTTIKPIDEVNRLTSTTQVNLELFARNISLTLPYNAIYGLKINTNGRIVTNWTANLEISQVMRP